MKATRYGLMTLAIAFLGISTAFAQAGSLLDIDSLKAAAEKGSADAQYKLAGCYMVGTVVSQDMSQGIMWYRKSSDGGNKLAQTMLGRSFLNGEGVSKNADSAAKWIGSAAKHGYGAAQLIYANMHLAGEGVRLDTLEAYKWVSLAVLNEAKGALSVMANIQITLGEERMERGDSIVHSHLSAQLAKTTDTDTTRLITQLATLGDANGQYRLGKIDLSNPANPSSVSTGIEWGVKSAEQGYAPAFALLASCYVSGTGVLKDPIHAHALLSTAGRKGERAALTQAESLGNTMSKDELEKSRMMQEQLEDPSKIKDIVVGF